MLIEFLLDKGGEYMKKSIVRIIFVILIVLAVIGVIGTTVFADVGSVLSDFQPETNSAAAKSVTNIGKYVVGVIQAAGTAIAIGMLLFLAIKYLKASPEGKGQIKETAVVYIIGAVVLFAAVNIVQIIYKFSTEAVTVPTK